MIYEDGARMAVCLTEIVCNSSIVIVISVISRIFHGGAVKIEFVHVFQRF
jgi:hypothetical protein